MKLFAINIATPRSRLMNTPPFIGCASSAGRVRRTRPAIGSNGLLFVEINRRPALRGSRGGALLAAILLAISPMTANADAQGEATGFKRLEWCDAASSEDRRAGFLFYCDDPPKPPPEEAKEKEPEEPVAKLPPPAPAPEPQNEEPTAAETLALITAEIEELRAEAILDPTNGEKVAAYMRAQQAAVERASVFADTWRRTVWTNPDLDYSIRRPTNAVSGPAFHEQRSDAEAEAIREVVKTRGLFFIFESEKTCVTCVLQAAILERLSAYYEVPVLGISRDGSALPQFPEPLHDPVRIEALGLKDVPVPALVLIEPETETVQPLAFAAIAEDQILERIFVLTQSEPGDLF